MNENPDSRLSDPQKRLLSAAKVEPQTRSMPFGPFSTNVGAGDQLSIAYRSADFVDRALQFASMEPPLGVDEQLATAAIEYADRATSVL